MIPINKEIRKRFAIQRRKTEEALGAVLWRLFIGEWCPECGTVLAIKTYANIKDGYGFEDDKIQCPHCLKRGIFKPKRSAIHKILWKAVPDDGDAK